MTNTMVTKIIIFVIISFVIVFVSSLILQTYEPTISTDLALDTVKESPDAWENMRGYQVIKSAIYAFDAFLIFLLLIVVFSKDVYAYLEKLSAPKENTEDN